MSTDITVTTIVGSFNVSPDSLYTPIASFGFTNLKFQMSSYKGDEKDFLVINNILLLLYRRLVEGNHF